MRFTQLLVIVLIIFTSCKTAEKKAVQPNPDPAHNSKNAIDWSGKYRGFAPCSNCQGIRSELTLFEEGYTFELKVQHNGIDTTIKTYRGEFMWTGNDQLIELMDIPFEFPKLWRVGENHLDMMEYVEELGTSIPSIERLEKVGLDSRLTDIRWQLIELNSRKIELTDKSRNKPHLYFNYAEYQVIGNSGCNMFHTFYRLGDEYEIRIDSSLTTTKMFCQEIEYESEFFETLTRTSSYEINGDILWIFDDKGVRILVFKEQYWD